MERRLSTGQIEREIHDAYLSLAESTALVRYGHEHYLDNLAAPAGDLSGTVTLLTEAKPRALADFGDPQWDYWARASS